LKKIKENSIFEKPKPTTLIKHLLFTDIINLMVALFKIILLILFPVLGKVCHSSLKDLIEVKL
jgi:hypothetical protein